LRSGGDRRLSKHLAQLYLRVSGLDRQLAYSYDINMKSNDTDELTIAPALQAEIRAAAADVHRPAQEIVQEALEGYLAAHPRVVSNAQTLSATVARMLKRRGERRLSSGVTIEDVIAWGREGRA